MKTDFKQPVFKHIQFAASRGFVLPQVLYYEVLEGGFTSKNSANYAWNFNKHVIFLFIGNK
jgi:hypothetical protein